VKRGDIVGYTTDFIGHIDIAPALNGEEIAYLTAFSSSRRCARPGGPYAVPGNPRAEELTTEVSNRVPDGQPGYWCNWVPCWDGCCLAYNGHEKFYGSILWLRYLIEHFLKPGAEASRSGERWFEGFTFDHVLEGLVVGCRRDNKELFAIHVSDNQVREDILRPADPRFLDFPPLPYEEENDRWLTRRARRRRGQRGQQADVVRFPGAG
jgi:hypothetical protein